MGTFFKKTLSFLGLAEDDSDVLEEENYSYKDDNVSLINENYRESNFGRHFSNLKNSQSYTQISEENPKKIWGSSKSSRKLLSIDSARESKKLRVSISEPHEFEEVQNIGDDLKVDIPVIVNLQNTNSELSKRIIDFCSGLTYALEGSIKKVADRVFLITPKNTVVTSSDKEILREKGLYNQL